MSGHWYRVISIWSGDEAALEKAHNTFMGLMSPNRGDLVFRVHSLPFGYAYCARDRAPLTMKYIKDAAGLFMLTHPGVTVNLHLWHRQDHIAVTRPLTEGSDIASVDENTYQLGVIALSDYYTVKTSTQGNATYTQIENMNDLATEQRKLYKTDEELYTALKKRSLQDLMMSELGHKPWDWEAEKEKPLMATWCVCKYPYANFRAKPCGHAYMCSGCQGDHAKHPILSTVCPKCLEDIKEIEVIEHPGPPSILVPKSAMALNVLDDDYDEAEYMDIEYYQSSDEDEDEKGSGS